ncbi:BRCA2 protein, partial [Sterrhoptilus dennistouni]|nr:BRCA2 protein [Sterrhoptilus dennistouni]
MACKPVERPTFFEIFKAHCSESDLGPISLNWFEELSAEAPPYEPRSLGEADGPSGWLDQTAFKTPRTKPSTYSQLASTPLLFKEQNATLPPSPEKEPDQKKIGANRENLISPSNTRRKIDQENEIFASPPGTFHNCLTASPTILKNTYRTPQRNNIAGPYGSLFCTPKLSEVRTPKCISESLGAEVDPDMSWSSSLATPPTLGETVIIARENDSISEAKRQDGRADTILHNDFSKQDKCPGISDASMLSVPETVKLNAEDDIKDFESEVLDGLLGDMDSFENTFSMPAESSGTLLLMPHALDAVEKYEINPDKTQEKGDVPSQQPNGRENGISQEVETNSWTENSHCTRVNGSLLQNTSEDTGDGKDGCSIGHKKELESLRNAGDVHDHRTHKSFENERPVKEGVQSPSSEWSQLNLSDLDVTHLEMSVRSSPPSNLHREENLGEKSLLMAKDDAVEISLLNSSGSIKAQKLLSVNLSEKCCEMKNTENNPTSEITPVKSVSLSVQDPELVKGYAAEVSKMSFLNYNSILTEHANVAEYSVVYGGKFSKHLKTTSKSVITDVLSHPLVCSATSPDNCDDLHLINTENTFTKSDFKNLKMLPSLRKRSKKFIYGINNTLLCQEEKTQKEITSESPIHTVLPHLESDSYKLRGCLVASDVEQGILLSFPSFHFGSNTTTNFSTSTSKMDIMDNSSNNSFSDRLKQQDLRDLGEKTGENQPATSIKCSEVSNALKEDTTNSLNSEITSDIKRKVLTSACRMARKRSRFVPKSCVLGKGEEDKDMSAKVNDGAAVPQSLKELGSSHRGRELLVDIHSDSTSVTNSTSHNKLFQINLGTTGVSSDCCNKLSPNKRHATDQRSGVDCREVHRPLRINCSEEDRTGLKQGEKTDTSFSEDVNSEDPKPAENSKSPQAAAFSNVAVDLSKELLDCVDNNSLNEVITVEDKQVAPMYSSKKPNKNLKCKEESLFNLNTCSLNLGFSGFQTASNKQIKFSEASIAKGRMLFKDIENECFEASSMEGVRNFSHQVKKENTLFSDSKSKSGSNLSDSSGSQASFLEPSTQFTPHKAGLCKSFPGTSQALQEANQTLTASQEAEIAELSSILEETGSQFEFTQFRRQSNTVQSHGLRQLGIVETHGTKNVENISETRKDVGVCSIFKPENKVKNDKYCTQEENTNEDSELVENEKENAVIFHKNDKKVTFTDLDINESRRSDESFPIAKQNRFSNFIGFTSAGGKKINISKAALSRSAELFRDLDDDNYLFKSSETGTRCHNSNGSVSSNSNFSRCLTKEGKEETVCVSDFKSMNAVSHTGSVSYHAQDKNEENTSTVLKGNVENKTKISVNNTESVSFYSTNIFNSLLPTKYHKRNYKTSKQILNQGDDEGNLQDNSLNVTCPEAAVATAGEHSLNTSFKMENESPEQKGEDRKEDKCLSPKLQTPAGGDISIPDAALDHSLPLFSVQCGEGDVDVLENSDKEKTNGKNMKEDTTHDKDPLLNESRIKIGSYRHYQKPLEQEVNVGKNEVEGSYLTGFHTASGKKIAIADGFLAKAEQFFADVDVGKEHNDHFENLIKERKCGKNCSKDCDLCIESIAQCDSEKLNFNEKLVPEELGNQFNQAIESSPSKHAVILEPAKVDTFVDLDEACEGSLVTSHAHKKADVRPGKSELESLTGQKSDALSRTHLSEDGKFCAEKKVDYSPRKRDDSENTDDFPVHSATSLHLMKVPHDLKDNCVPGDTKTALFVEESSNKADQSVLLDSKSICSYMDGTKEFDLEHLNEPAADKNHFTDNIASACQNQSLVSLPEEETNFNRLKETTCKVERQRGDLKQTMFSTAKGKAVSVSESALARVRQMFQDCSEAVKYEIEPNSRMDQTEIARRSPAVLHAECPNSAKSFHATTSEEVNSAASQFIKVNASADEDGHQERNTTADAKSVSNSQKQSFEQNIKLLGPFVPNKQIKLSDASTSSFGFFSTASGKAVQLSEESLRKARQLFSEMEDNHSLHVQEAFLVEEDVEKSEMHTEVLPRKMQVVSSKGEENTSPELISDSAFGFSTASGKQVKVSKDAYRKAKAILEESDYFLSSGLCTTDQLSSIKDSGQHVKSLTDKVISEFKTEKSCNQDSDVKSICPQEMRYFPSTYHVRMPEHTPYNQKNMQVTSFKNKFQPEESESFRKGQRNLGSKPESEAISCSATAKAEINTNFQSPKNYLEVEAVESARAFMEDSLSSAGVQINAAQTFSGRLDKNFQNKTFGKRHFEENNSLGEPPIKRQLLLEFNRTTNSPRSLKASKSTPDGIFKDRRKFMYHVPLKPITCQPFGSAKERQEVKNPTLTLPDQDFRGFQSKPAIFQHYALRHSSEGAAEISTPCKASAKESEEMRSLYESGKAAKTFIPPFKTKLTFSACEQGSSKKCDSPISKNMTKEMELNEVRTEQNTGDPQDNLSCTQHAADTDLENGNLAMARMVTNLRCARDLQEMRIKKKCRQNIRSQPGTLYVIKTSASNRISLKTAVEEKSPNFYSTEQLYTYGVSKQCVQVNSTNAESFQFLIKDFFSKEYLLAGNGMQLADGGWLIPTDEGKAGKKEFYRALCDTPGVDPNLITEAWVYNHYRWIVWKLAAMEVSFPHEFANRCLTPEMVLLQLKYRYDLEVDKSKRSAIKKIMERDDAAGKTLVLCISKIISLSTVVSPSSSNKNVESKKAAALIEVTDGWYGIRALLDPPLKAFLDTRRLTVGQKIIVHGAELVGPQNGCTPLEAPDSLMLKISANSTRRVRWHTKLGFHRDPRPFPLPLSSLYSEGGAVGCIDVVIQRTYPIQWMEKTSAGSYVFRNSRAEEREAAKHAEDQQKKLEALFAKIQAEYEKHEERTSRRTPRSRIVTRQQIHNLQDGAELYEAIQNASDPGYMEGYLSDDQLKALKDYRQMMNDRKQTQIQEQLKKALESAEQEENGCYKRDVSAVWRLYVVDYRKQEKHKGAVLSIWRPLPDVCSLLKEGARYRIFQLAATQGRGRADSTNIQLTATKKTQYLQLSVSQEMLGQIFFPRKALEFTSLLDPSFQPPRAEVDLVGVVISVSRTGFTTVVYLSDESYNLVAIKIWTDLRHLAIEDVVVRCSLISASNLQWQSEFRSEIPVLLAGDLSLFSASPKECYLQEKVNELRSVIENVASFCSDAESKLMNLLRRNLLLSPSVTKRCGLESPSPSCSYTKDKSLISSRIEMKHPSPLSTSTPNIKLVTPGSAKTPSPATVNEDHLKTSKKRKAMDFLSCIPAPPPLTPICSVISPSVKRAFQPPRTLGLQHSKSPKETGQNTGHVTPCRKVRETVHLPENDLVADEELAMINTQALVNNLPEEKKMGYVNENSNATATTLSDNLSSRNSSRST